MSSVIRTVNLWQVGCPLNLKEDGCSLKGLRSLEFVLSDGERLDGSYLPLQIFIANFSFCLPHRETLSHLL